MKRFFFKKEIVPLWFFVFSISSHSFSEDEGFPLNRLAKSLIRLSGTATMDGEISIIYHHGETKATVLVKSGETGAQICQKFFSQTKNSFGLEPDGITLIIYNSSPGLFGVRTRDPGLIPVNGPKNFKAKPDMANKKIVLKWEISQPFPDQIYLWKNPGDNPVYLPGNCTRYEDDQLEKKGRGIYTYFSILAGSNVGGKPMLFSDALKLETENPLEIDSTDLTIYTTVIGDWGKKGKEFNWRFEKTGGTSPVTWSIASGKLPQGLELRPRGHLYGIPTETGAFTIEVKVTDAEGEERTRTFSFKISDPQPPK